MTDLHLYKTGTRKVTVWYVSQEPICAVCGEIINEPIAAHIISWARTGYDEVLCHYTCVRKHKVPVLTIYQERRGVVLSPVVPGGAEPILITPPILVTARRDATSISTFQATSLKSEHTVDNTVFSDKADRVHAQIEAREKRLLEGGGVVDEEELGEED